MSYHIFIIYLCIYIKDCAAIASDLAGATYGLDVLERNIEDDDNNYTRFLLLSRQSVSALLPPAMPAKTSIVFLLPNNPGALYKALACFSLRDIDFCKIESRPTSVQLLQSLQLKKSQQVQTSSLLALSGPNVVTDGNKENALMATEYQKYMDNIQLEAENAASMAASAQILPRFQYTFYLDFLAAELDDRTQNALGMRVVCALQWQLLYFII